MHNELATIESNEQISSIYQQMVLSAPLIAKDCHPGQFINILPDPKWTHVMRRPMSIASQSNGKISIIYKVVGEGTSILNNLKPGDSLDIIGPLGNYWTDFDTDYPVLLAGGVGIAPILYLHDHLLIKKIPHHLIMGTRTKDEHFFKEKTNASIVLTTDDGSYGIRGSVINALDSIVSGKNSSVIFFACGPSPMLNAVNRFATDKNINCYLALETLMACGFGICQGCAIEITNNSAISQTYRNQYALVCADGPIFDGKDIPLC
ncbi:MAG: dihydroorotate dehydrogenase electron transfer subunit [Candidatus Marinimicrobia bacterium]|nr:dihydroorotate dehydrogenase electron transfer subunit [Candidatus Neomarinimicrobiota bacterium]